MKPHLFCKLLLRAAFLFVDIEGAPESSPWLTPIPNIDLAMMGFDTVMANPFETPNPGIRNQIFEPMSELPDGRITVNSFIDKVSEDLQCHAELSGKTIRNYNEFRQEKSSFHELAGNADASISGGGFGITFRASAGYGRESTDEENSIQKLFRETNGEVVKSEAECITHSVGISLFEKPVFTAAFKTALRELHVAAKTPDTNSSGRVYVKFVQSYGTHFMKTTFLGSKLIFEKRFTSKADDSDVQRARSECVSNSAYASLGGKVGSVGAAASFEMLSKTCENADESRSFFQNNGLSSVVVISIGSLPHGDLKTWSHTVKQSPVPIFYELEKISSLFQSKWFSTILTDDTDPTSERLNGTSMYTFFETRSASYCQLILGKPCLMTIKGCGYNSLCRKKQTCVTDQSTDDGYICSDVNKYGPALIMGGYNGSSRLSSGDAIDTWILPNLPVAMSVATLSAVGSNIYNCGGYSSGERTSLCYVIDRAAVSPQWVSTTPLPVAMSYHTSVTIKDHIWTVYNNKLHDLNTHTNTTHTYHLPLTVSSGHCAVSNGSHSFIFGAGSSYEEIWVNTEENNPAKWHRVGNSLAGREWSGCVWYEQEVFITGGYSGKNSTEVFDTLTYSTRSAGSLIQGRLYHKMMVLDGSPAVLGGYDYGKRFSSIETYDNSTEKWVGSSRSLGEARQEFGLVQLHG